jgi:putative alpha-1,2-mannosidase
MPNGADAPGKVLPSSWVPMKVLTTGGEGHTFPGAVVPFGMIQLSPDTQIRPRKEAYGWAAGYRHDDSTIVGFSHTHFSGTGHSDLGDVLVMPIAGEVKLERGDVDKPGSGYTSRFRHEDEVAQPGYYAVTLDDYGIRAELTAGPRVGVHRYAFPKGKPAHVLVDLRTSLYDYPGKVSWSRLRLHPMARSPGSAKRAAGRQGASCTSRCASRCRSADINSTTRKATCPTRASRRRATRIHASARRSKDANWSAHSTSPMPRGSSWW